MRIVVIPNSKYSRKDKVIEGDKESNHSALLFQKGCRNDLWAVLGRHRHIRFDYIVPYNFLSRTYDLGILIRNFSSKPLIKIYIYDSKMLHNPWYIYLGF